MHLQCALGHKWEGCRCARCGEVRDSDHDWECVHCHVKCRRCGMVKGFEHAWQGCVCQNCGATKHQWTEGVCQHCGLRCEHKEIQTTYEGFHDDFTARAIRIRTCKLCGMRIRPSPV